MKQECGKPISRLAALLGALVMTLALTGCPDDSEKAPEAVGQPTLKDGTADMAANGGTVSIQSASSPIFGAKVEIEDASLDGAERIVIAYEDALPKALNTESLALGGKQISKVLVLTRDGKADFGKAVRVTMPFDKAALAATAVPIVVSWDEAAQTYTPVTIRSLDRTAGTVSFMTAHFSKYVVIVLDKLFGTTPPAATAFTYDTGFRAASDGFFDHNFGSYDSPGGNCFGMAGYAAWFHAAKKAVKGAGLYTLYREGPKAPELEEDDQTARELITRAYQAGNQKGHLQALDWINDLGFATRELGDRFTAYSIISQLIVTKQSQIMAMGVGGFFKWSVGHAVTVYAYDGTRKVFQFYDNNFPNEVIELPWDPVAGFSSYTVKNTTWDRFAFASFNQAYSTATLESLYNGAENGWASSNFPKINVTTPTELATIKGVSEVASEDNVTITGTVPRLAGAANAGAQRYLHVYLNGVAFGTAVPVANSNDTFNVSIPKLPAATGTDVMLLVSESPNSWRGVFTSFKQFKIRVANQFFFKNLGFETGAFGDWVSERHLWDGSGKVTPSDKSVVVKAGLFDSIATDLPVSFFGGYAARVNNQDNGEHISTLQQTAVVPKATNPTLRFYWAAVLEDPQHAPADQPYVEVTVTNTSKNIVLYRKRFYSNDPTYTGWKSYQSGSWKAIPWQPVNVPVAAYVGDTIVLKVEAADCALGAHGGYAYVDAEE